jgi:peptidoglycan hydrolase-like protein with peptidoglycan-binding domain
MIPIWLLWAAGGLGAYTLFERVVKKEKHPFTSTSTLPGQIRAKAIEVVKSSSNPAQLRALGNALATKGETKIAAAAQNKAQAIEAQQAPYVRAIQTVDTGTRPPAPTPAKPAAAPAPLAVPKTVRQGTGSRARPDPDVIKLQTILGLTADGIFGPQTRMAVVQFQRSHSLTTDGIVGPQTWTALLRGG